jgi:hypothetical protein
MGRPAAGRKLRWAIGSAPSNPMNPLTNGHGVAKVSRRGCWIAVGMRPPGASRPSRPSVQLFSLTTIGVVAEFGLVLSVIVSVA